MKALTLKDYKENQYATLVEQGVKDIETRKWKPKEWREGMEWDLLITCSKSSASVNKGKAIIVVTLYHIEDMRQEHEERAMCPLYYRNEKKKLPAHAWFFKNRRVLNKKFDIMGRLSIFEVKLPKGITLTPAEPYYPTELVVSQKQGNLFL